MSLATWKKEFYPISASKCPKSSAIAHSLQKWLGLTKKNLKKHGCALSASCVCDNETDSSFEIDQGSCSLCHHYYGKIVTEREDGWEEYCTACPIYKIRGRACDCSEYDADNECVDRAPYGQMFDGNVRPMINLLKKALKQGGKAKKAKK